MPPRRTGFTLLECLDMADFCHCCYEEHGFGPAEKNDLKGLVPEGDFACVICEGCGPCWVDSEGKNVTATKFQVTLWNGDVITDYLDPLQVELTGRCDSHVAFTDGGPNLNVEHDTLVEELYEECMKSLKEVQNG